MFRMLNKKRGQNTAEYAILIGVIVAAAIAMQVYVRRGMQGRVRDAVDYSLNMNVTGESGGQVFTTPQYEPYYMDQNLQTQQDSTQREEMIVGGQRTISDINQTITRTGHLTAGNYTEWNTTGP